MPRVACPGCGKTISDTASRCFNCGRPVSTDEPPFGTPGEACPFFAVSLRKFVVMSIVTFGIYELYWAYKNWMLIKARSSEQLSPVWRAWFAQLWSFSLFSRIRDGARERGLHVEWTPVWLAAGYLLMTLFVRLPGTLALLSVLSFLPILPVVQTIATVHEQGRFRDELNARYSTLDCVAIAIGGLALVAAAVGLFLLPTPAEA
jgi:uncharacterized protein DUF4234